MFKKFKKIPHDWNYQPIEVDPNTTKEDMIKRLQETAQEMNAIVSDNRDGTWSFTRDGSTIIVEIE